MKVNFRQSGGFTGLVRGIELDTACMEREEEKLLLSLVSRCPDPPSEKAPSGTARDTVIYEITLEEPGTRRKIRFEEPSIPAEAEPLIDFLAARSSPRSP